MDDSRLGLLRQLEMEVCLNAGNTIGERQAHEMSDEFGDMKTVIFKNKVQNRRLGWFK